MIHRQKNPGKLSESISVLTKRPKITAVAAVFLICFTSLVFFEGKNSQQGSFLVASYTRSFVYSYQNFKAKILGGSSYNISASLFFSEQNNASLYAETVSRQKPKSNYKQSPLGELASGFEKESCLSRHQQWSLYRKTQRYKPSHYLISRLRDYQNLHARCGPQSGQYKNETTTCKYFVWTQSAGLGNRILSITSVFLYALLESRVLLVDFQFDMTGLFCEPFPNSTWLLPEDFPHRKASNYDFVHTSPFIQRFHCNDTQKAVRDIPILVAKSDIYFIPLLFMSRIYEQELNRMFPEKEAVFHLLGHYLFNPSNQAWRFITKFYDDYLAKADEIIGLQIRVFDKPVLHKEVMSQILDCLQQQNILSAPMANKSVSLQSQNHRATSSKLKAVVIASLYPQFSEKLSTMYLWNPTVTGEIVGVYQPSQEGKQSFYDKMQNMKAWTEIYLLSLSQVLVTTGQSTFGYVAQGLGGLNPWFMPMVGSPNGVRNPACARDISPEPCFHFGPTCDCDGHDFQNITALNPHLKACDDLWSDWRGTKLVDW